MYPELITLRDVYQAYVLTHAVSDDVHRFDYTKDYDVSQFAFIKLGIVLNENQVAKILSCLSDRDYLAHTGPEYDKYKAAYVTKIEGLSAFPVKVR